MQKKPVTPAKKSVSKTASKSAAASRSTPVRNTPIPKAVAKSAGKKMAPITSELISERAYFISISGNGGSDDENWLRAERELRGL